MKGGVLGIVLRLSLPAALVLGAFAAVLSLPSGARADEWGIHLASNFALDLAVRGDGVWAATSGGVVHLAPDGSFLEKLTSLDGLPSNLVQKVAIDSEGDLWFGTVTGGAARVRSGSGAVWVYHGTEGLFTEEVTALAPIGSSTWVGTTGGVARIVGDNQEAEGRDRYNESLGLRADSVLVVAEFGGSLWFGTSRGLSQLDPDVGFVDHLTTHIVRALLDDGGGFLWAGTDSGAYRWDGAAWTYLSTGMPSTGTPSRRDVHDLAMSGDTLWAAVGPSGGTARWTGTNWVAENSGLTGKWRATHAIGGDPTGGLWAATEAGLALRDGTTWTHQIVPGPPSNYCTFIGSDGEGGVWLATGTDANLFAFGGEPWTGAQGAGRYAGGAWTDFVGADGLTGSNIYRVTGDGAGHVYAGGWGSGISRYDLGTALWDTLRTADTLTAATLVVSDEAFGQGGIWIGAYTLGVVYASPNTSSFIDPVTIYTPGAGLPSAEAFTYPRALAVDGDILWVGTHGADVAGLAIAGIDTRGTPADPGDDAVTVFAPDDASSLRNWEDVAGTIYDLLVEPDGTLWGATAKGVLSWDGTQMTTYTRGAGGLTIGEVRSIARAPDGRLWFATAQGLARLENDRVTWQLYTAAETGLPSDDVRSVYADPSTGDIWAGTWGSGLARLSLSPAATAGTGNETVVIAPHPFRPASDGEVSFPDVATEDRLRIYSLSGELVREFPPGELKRWDGRDRDGRTVASGLYLVTAEDARGIVRHASLAVVR